MTQELDAEVRRLARTIYKLMGDVPGGWPGWRMVARHHSGSDEQAELLSGLAELPQYKHLFVCVGPKVKLTEEGLEFARSEGGRKRTLPEIIADSVVAYARGLTPIVLEIQSVTHVAKLGNKVVHAFEVELSDEILPNETPVQVVCNNGQPISGKLVGQETDGGTLYVACGTDILPVQQATRLKIDRAYLLTELANQIRLLSSVPSMLESALKPTKASPIADTDSISVVKQLAKLQTPWTQFLWGPPGSGKTFGLGHMVAKLLEENPHESVLIVAPSNRAVDVAVNHLQTRLAVNSMKRLIDDRRILRFGYPRHPDVLKEESLLGPIILDDLNRAVRQNAREITLAEERKATAAEIAVLRAKLLVAQEAVRDAVKEHVGQCSVVATTTTLAYMPTSPVATRLWDTVIVDEVTMVPPAMCVYLASRAKRRLLLAGDPCQLGPVFEDRGATLDPHVTTWLKNDIFTLGKVSTGKLSPEAIDISDGRMSRITAQRRCAGDIWDRVSHLYPQVANAANAARNQNTARLSPASGAAVALIDLAGGDARCEKMRRSWRNPESAMIALKTAKMIAAQNAGFRIAIICPYRAQVKMIRDWLREDHDQNQNRSEAVIEVGSVHQFQGSEADVVLFDLVDGPGRENLGLLLKGDTGTRLLNVAITRARGKLIVIADRVWCRNANVALHNPLLAQLVLGRGMVEIVTPDEMDRSELLQSIGPSRFENAHMNMAITQISASAVALAALALPVITVADPPQQPMIVAHRGLLQQAPENTLANFRACLELRLGFEFDVQRTKDGHLVCIHDDTMNRTTNGTGRVADLTLDEIRRLDAGSWFDANFAGEKVPTVGEVLALVANHRQQEVLIAVDLKAEGVEQDVVRLADKHKMLDRLLFIGRTITELEVRKRIKSASTKAQTATVANNADEFSKALAAANSDCVYFRYLPTKEQAEAVRVAGKRSFIAGITVSGNVPDNWRQAADVGIDDILTDYPLELRAMLRKVRGK